MTAKADASLALEFTNGDTTMKTLNVLDHYEQNKPE